MTISYRFMPWVRKGLARSHQNADNGNNFSARPKVNVGLTLQAKQNGSITTTVSGNFNLALYGPGDIIGIDQRLIVRTEPKANITNFEPNYLAAIDFDPPDFPWLLTPAKANAKQNLHPWLVLVVLDRSVIKSLPQLKPGQALPSISLTADAVNSELPNLAESYLWAHAQAVSDTTVVADLINELEKKPAGNISRLVCPRRLEARKNYLACVVPAFDAGRIRGLGQTLPKDMSNLSPAWTPGHEAELPVYYYWEFSTGPVGDIETLARRLKTPRQCQDDLKLQEQLREIGIQKIAVDADRLLLANATADSTVFEGALVSLELTPKPVNAVFTQKLAAILNSPQTLSMANLNKANTVPTLSPPIYGEYPTGRHTVNTTNVNQKWLDQLNLQPRYRLAAGYGAEIVRRNQEEFMQAAWTQVGEVLAAERALSLSRFSQQVLKGIARRHIEKLPVDRLLSLLSPARARILLDTNQSLYGRIGSATMPDELFDGAMRRLTSSRRSTFKMAQFRSRLDKTTTAFTSTTSSKMTNLVNAFANAVQNSASINPNQFVPDGIMGSRSFDSIALPASSSAVIDLLPYTGLPGTMTAGEIRQIQLANTAYQQQAATLQRTAPQMDDIFNKGLITEAHVAPLLELQKTSGQLLQGNVYQLIQQTSIANASNVELSIQANGNITAQAMKPDAAGTPRTIGATASIAPLSSTQSNILFATKITSSTATVTTTGSIQQTTQTAQVALAKVIVPVAIKDTLVLNRYATAFQDYQKLYRDPGAQSQRSISAQVFNAVDSREKALSRIDPAKTVPARLASQLAFSEQPVIWSQQEGFKHATINSSFDRTQVVRRPYLIPKGNDRVMAYPHLQYPLSRKLADFAADVFLPGVGNLPDDFIMAVQTNPRFVESLMLGANHEMGRELLWQGFPTDQRGTPFQHFWQRLDSKNDIDEIHRWNSNAALGSQPGSTPMLVLLIRGQLLERFPGLSIYAYPKKAGDTRPVAVGKTEMESGEIRLPVLKGHLGKDITYVGFDIDPNAMENFFFILEEHMTEPRFGFDEPDNDGQNGSSWLDVDWNEVDVNPSQYFGSTNLKKAPPALNKAEWVGPHAATVANALLQRPFRGYYAGAMLTLPTAILHTS